MSWCCGTLSPYREEQQCHHCQVSTDFAGITTTPQHCGSNSISVEYILHRDHRFTQSRSNHTPPPASTYTTECTLAAKPMSKNISLTAAVPLTPFLSLQCRKQTNLIVAAAVTVATTLVCHRYDECICCGLARCEVCCPVCQTSNMYPLCNSISVNHFGSSHNHRRLAQLLLLHRLKQQRPSTKHSD